MCLCAFHYAPTPEKAKVENFQLILIFNRDENYARPTAPVHEWKENGLIGGQDREKGREGGTWLVMSTETGRIGALTNHLNSHIKDKVILTKSDPST